ncbi:MAG: MFS transporter [Phycisphaerales bacterium]|nr:MAG: MFS transporter [Phycisphaerales bacterium]
MAEDRAANPTSHDTRTPLPAVMVLTALASVGTAVIWNGIAFVAKHDYGFNKRQTLLMYLLIGVVYVVGALSTGPLTRKLKGTVSSRGLLAVILIIQSAVCITPILFDGQWVLWMVAGVNILLAAFFWPTVESYTTAGRHGDEMRRAIGWFNLIWMAAVAGTMLSIAPLIEHGARLAIVGLGGASALGVVTLRWFRPSPGAHDEGRRQASVGAEYRRLLHSARVLLPLSYVLMAAMSPLLPYLFQRLQLDVFWETPTAATWMTMRVAAVGLMWHFGFWHGRWGTLLLGGLAMTGGFALVVLGPNVAMMLLGFASFGAGLGIVYYAALYYAMSVGGAQIDAGGKHEALIGTGNAIGPAAGLIGITFARGAPGDELQMAEGVAVVTVVCVITLLGAVAAFGPYLKARRARNGDGAGS